MKANCWYGAHDVRVETVPDPKILNPRDAIVKVTSTAICGSDLHLYDGFIPTMETGRHPRPRVHGRGRRGRPRTSKNLKVGDRVVVPFTIACGSCFFCQEAALVALRQLEPERLDGRESLWATRRVGPVRLLAHDWAATPAGRRSTCACRSPTSVRIKVPERTCATSRCCSSPTSSRPATWRPRTATSSRATRSRSGAADRSDSSRSRSAFLLGADRVIAIDRFPERLRMARQQGAETINYEEVDVLDALKEMTGGRGPDACIDAVGIEAHATGLTGLYDRVKQALRLETDRPDALRQAILACRKGGTVSVPGVYGGFLDKMPFGSVMNRDITIRSGQTHVHKYLAPLLKRIIDGDVDPSFVVTHTMSLADAPEAYAKFRSKEDGCIKVVMKPSIQ